MTVPLQSCRTTLELGRQAMNNVDPTLRSKVRPEALKCLHRDFSSVTANRANHGNNNNSHGNGDKRDKLAHRVSLVSVFPSFLL